jgi:hypothetical protein
MNLNKPVTITFLLLMLFSEKIFSQDPINRTTDQLMAPSELASILKDYKGVPLIFSIGPGALIPHSKDIGAIKEKENMKKFKTELNGLQKNTPIIVYCGCCPYAHCPNVRPAIQLLKDMKFTSYKLLDLPHNIRIDWIDKGYPTVN